jgi:hypothetical protein
MLPKHSLNVKQRKAVGDILNIPEATASGDHKEFSEARCVFQAQEAAFFIKYVMELPCQND